MTKLKIVLLACLIFFPQIIKSQQENFEEETNPSIPALTNFHEVIYPIWHTAYPEKDFDMLKDLRGEVNEKSIEIINAELPGILRDKKIQWENGISEFREAVSNYNSAAENNDGNKLLTAAENLHSAYEKLVRIIKPVTPQIAEFHKTLYLIYHHFLPDNNMEKIKEVSVTLVTQAKEIKNSKLPKKLEDKKKDFESLADNLIQAAVQLEKICSDANTDNLSAAVESVHTNYQQLEAFFE